jgi:subfamily B ATP-binding cassette protein MsbA
MFNDTIKNNITLWSEIKDENKLDKASRRAALSDYVNNCVEGYETHMGDDGMKVSGGQRQRICIARELYKDIKLIIFDEATSNLDSHTELEIHHYISRMQHEKTVLMIAHRLSTVKECDVIYVLKEGKIIEQGNYPDLIKGNGEFRRMVELQAAGEGLFKC